MASFTTNYNLDLYEAGDIPNLLDQYDGAMNKVDTALASVNTVATAAGTTASNAATAAATADGKAVAAQGTADQAMSLAQTNKSDIASLETTVQQHTTSISSINDDISELGTQVNQNASDITDLENEIQTIGTAHRSSGTITVPSTISGLTVTTRANSCYKDTALHIASFALRMIIAGGSARTTIPAGTALFTLPQQFRPSTARNIVASMLQMTATTSEGVSTIYPMNFRINTDGTCIALDSSNDPASLTIEANNYMHLFIVQPCLFTHEWGANY